jgi:hypothetical protein
MATENDDKKCIHVSSYVFFLLLSLPCSSFRNITVTKGAAVVKT